MELVGRLSNKNPENFSELKESVFKKCLRNQARKTLNSKDKYE